MFRFTRECMCGVQYVQERQADLLSATTRAPTMRVQDSMRRRAREILLMVVASTLAGADHLVSSRACSS